MFGAGLFAYGGVLWLGWGVSFESVLCGRVCSSAVAWALVCAVAAATKAWASKLRVCSKVDSSTTMLRIMCASPRIHFCVFAPCLANYFCCYLIGFIIFTAILIAQITSLAK